MTNAPDKSEMKAVTIPGDLYAFLMGEGEIDGTAFGDLNANLPGRFWWRALLRTAASSRPPADQVPDMVERVFAAIQREAAPGNKNFSEREIKSGVRLILQTVPAAGEVGETRVRDAAAALIADIRRRYPGEELRCEYMRELDAALKAQETGE